MKKVLSLIVATVLVLFTLAGCSSPSNKSGSTTSNGTSTSKVNISLMQSKTEIQSDLQKVIDYYNKSQDKVNVKLLGTSGDNYTTVLQSQFSSTPAKAPTIFAISGPETKQFQPYMAEIKGSKAASMIAEGAKDEVTVDGKLLGLPAAVEGYGLIYNKDMFKQANIDPASITSINALVDACKKLSSIKGVVHPIAFAKENYFSFVHPINWAFAIDPNYKSDIDKINKGQITMKDVPTVAQWIKDLDALKPYTNKALDSYDDQIAGFASGKYAIIHQGDWAQQVIDQDKPNFQYGMIPYPTSNNTKLAVGTAMAWRINKYATSDQQKAALDFLDWLITSEKGQDFSANTLKFIPAYKGVKAPDKPLAADVTKYVNDGNTVPWVYNTDFPNGIDIDGASLMQKYYASPMTDDQFLSDLTKIWVQDAGK